MKFNNGMIHIKNLNLIKITWTFIILNYNQVYGVDCPENYVCANGSRFYIWTGSLATLTGAEKMCDNLGLLMLKVPNKYSFHQELLRPNLTQVIKEDTSVWLGTKYDSNTREHRWLDTDEVFDFDQPDSSAGDCLVIKDHMTRIVSANCRDMNHVVCMETSVHWFGSGQRFMCHCRLGGCDMTNGTCNDPLGGCALGWFGEGCQLRDALPNLKQRLLIDFNRGICNRRGFEVAFLVNPSAYFSWIRIVSQEKVDNDTYSVALTTSRETLLCPEAKSVVIADDTVDIACCTNLSLVTRVVIRWRGTRTLCSVHMYQGQNVASQGRPTVASNGHFYDAHFSVDGYRSIISPSFSSSLTHALNLWTLDFDMERIVFEVIIYLKYALATDVNIILEFKSSLDASVERNNAGVSLFQHGAHMLRLLSGTLEKVKRVIIYFHSMSDPTDNHLDLSEVEVYGACSPPNNSLYCDEACAVETEVDLCYYDGECDISHATTTTTTLATTSTSVTTPSTITTETARTQSTITTTSVDTTSTTTTYTDNASTHIYYNPKKKRDQKEVNYLKYYFLFVPLIGFTLMMCCNLRNRSSIQEDISMEDRESLNKKETDANSEKHSEYSKGSAVDIESQCTSQDSKSSPRIHPVGILKKSTERREGKKLKGTDETPLIRRWFLNFVGSSVDP